MSSTNATRGATKRKRPRANVEMHHSPQYTERQESVRRKQMTALERIKFDLKKYGFLREGYTLDEIPIYLINTQQHFRSSDLSKLTHLNGIYKAIQEKKNTVADELKFSLIPDPDPSRQPSPFHVEIVFNSSPFPTLLDMQYMSVQVQGPRSGTLLLEIDYLKDKVNNNAAASFANSLAKKLETTSLTSPAIIKTLSLSRRTDLVKDHQLKTFVFEILRLCIANDPLLFSVSFEGLPNLLTSERITYFNDTNHANLNLMKVTFDIKPSLQPHPLFQIKSNLLLDKTITFLMFSELMGTNGNVYKWTLEPVESMPKKRQRNLIFKSQSVMNEPSPASSGNNNKKACIRKGRRSASSSPQGTRSASNNVGSEGAQNSTETIVITHPYSSDQTAPCVMYLVEVDQERLYINMHPNVHAFLLKHDAVDVEGTVNLNVLQKLFNDDKFIEDLTNHDDKDCVLAIHNLHLLSTRLDNLSLKIADLNIKNDENDETATTATTAVIGGALKKRQPLHNIYLTSISKLTSKVVRAEAKRFLIAMDYKEKMKQYKQLSKQLFGICKLKL